MTRARLFPLLPFRPDETLWSWVARMAAFHIRGTIDMFLHDLGFDPFAVSVGDPDEVSRLCDLAGQDPAMVLGNTVIHHGRRRRQLGNEFLFESLCPHDDLRFCPACLAEDDRAAETARQRPAIHRRERLIWRIRQIGVCPDHAVPLIRRDRPDAALGIGVFADQVPEGGAGLDHLPMRSGHHPSSPFQLYLAGRIEGRRDSPWLDSLPFEEAVRIMELLGTVLEFGPHVRPDDLGGADREAAAVTGWYHASRGEDGIHQALRILHAESDERKTGRPALWNTYGALMAEIEEVESIRPLRSVFTEHIARINTPRLVG